MLPLSAITAGRDRQGSSPVAFRSQVFSTSQQNLRPLQLVGLFHPTGTPRVLIFRALPATDRQLFTAAVLLRCYRLYMVFFQKLLAVPTAWPPDLRPTRPWLSLALCCKQPVSILRFGRTLKLCSRLTSVSYATRFHSDAAITALMTFCPSGYQASPPWMLSFLFRGSRPS